MQGVFLGKIRASQMLTLILILLIVGRPVESEAGTQTIRNVEYQRAGEDSLRADLYLPEGPGPFPTVLFVHGGAWTSGDKWNALLHARQLAQAGFAVVAINYRLAPDDQFPAQLEDCEAAVDWIVKNADQYQFDPQRLLGFGYSAGAHLISLLAVRGDETAPRLRAIAAGGAPCDLLSIPRKSRFLEYFLGATREENPEIYRAATPHTFVTPDDPPFFFYHGEADLLVPISSAQSLRKRLIEAGIRAEMHVVPQQGHLGAFLDRSATQRVIEFFQDILEPAPPIPPARPVQAVPPGEAAPASGR